MMDNKPPVISSQTLIIMALTGIAGWLAWISNSHIETDRVQDVVLERLSNLEQRDLELTQEMHAMPLSIDDQDRWYKNNEMEYQQYIDDRIRRLERYHPPYSECGEDCL